MNLFFKRNRTKEYHLWGDWKVTLSGEYEHVDNGDSGQLCNEDASRIIYGSVFELEGIKDIEDKTDYAGIKRGKNGEYNLSATVVQRGNFLSITLTYLDPSDEDWAISVVESARRS